MAALYRFQLKSYNKLLDWFEGSKPLVKAMKTGCPNPVKIQIHPVIVNPISDEETKMYFGFGFKDRPSCD